MFGGVVFTLQSSLVQSYALLIVGGHRAFDSVPNVGNLREMVALYLTQDTQATQVEQGE